MSGHKKILSNNHVVVDVVAVSASSLPPAYDPEGFGGDTCEFGKCCLNPCGYLIDKIFYLLDNTPDSNNKQEIRCLLWIKLNYMYTTYIIGCYGVWVIIFIKLYPIIRRNKDVVPLYHLSIGNTIFVLCFLSWVNVSCCTKPGAITKETMQKYDNYPYDNILYKNSNNICPTLQIRKLARSKYDRYSKTHVPKFDHNCRIINRTIGEENYRWFLLFLLIHTIMCCYGTMIVGTLLVSINYLKFQQMVLSISFLFTFLLNNTFLIGLFSYLLMCSIGLISFFGFHLYIITSLGMTTNEYYKWKEIVNADNNNKYKSRDIRNLHTYNLGFYKNVQEVLFPRCLRKIKTKKSLNNCNNIEQYHVA